MNLKGKLHPAISAIFATISIVFGLSFMRTFEIGVKSLCPETAFAIPSVCGTSQYLNLLDGMSDIKIILCLIFVVTVISYFQGVNRYTSPLMVSIIALLSIAIINLPAISNIPLKLVTDSTDPNSSIVVAICMVYFAPLAAVSTYNWVNQPPPPITSSHLHFLTSTAFGASYFT